MRYTESFKAEVLQSLRDSGKPVAAVAQERGIATSTLFRWQAEYRPLVRAAPTRQERDDLEVAELVSWLDREEGEVRSSLLKSNQKHVRWMKTFNAVSMTLGLAVLIAAVVVTVFVFIHLAAAEPALPLRVYVAWLIGILVATYLLCLLLDAVISCVAGLRGPFVMAVLRIMAAEQLLARDKSFALVDPVWWNVPARLRRRELKRSLRKAEGLLLRRTRLGKAFQTAGAREWELNQRRQAASALASIEVQLEREGSRAYEPAGMCLRQLASLTLMREWAVDRLPQLPEVVSRYQSPLVRLARRLWVPVPLLGAVVTLALAVPEIRDRLF